MIQREGRPKLDLTPDATPKTAGWDEKYNVSGNDNNKPVEERKGKAPDNGWTKENVLTTYTKDND